jgi:hypothetical protein
MPANCPELLKMWGRLGFNVGQVGNLRPIVNRPATGPRKLLGRFNQPRVDRIHLNVPSNAPKFRPIATQSIVTLVLPERPPSQTQDAIPLSRRESLERLHHFEYLHMGSDQQVHMIRHDGVRVKLVVLQMPLPIPNRLHHHIRDLRLPKIQRSGTSVVEQAVHGHEGLSCGSSRRESAVCGKATVESPSQEYRLAGRLIVRQSAGIEGRHDIEVAAGQGNSFKSRQADCQSAAGLQPAPHGSPT